MIQLSRSGLLFAVALFFVCFYNVTFFRHVLEVYPFTLKNCGFLFSLGVGLTAFIVFLENLVCYRKTVKPVLIFFLILSASAAYFMDQYQVVIDYAMVQNILETNLREARDLLSFKLVLYLFFLGIAPSLFIARVRIKEYPLKQTVLIRLRDLSLAFITVFAMILLFSKFYTSFFREHKPLRYYTNPTYYIYSVGKYIHRTLHVQRASLQPIGVKARSRHDAKQRKLLIMVVGEAARADHFSLNGYARKTNPRLEQEDVVFFEHISSCGTSTAYSVPCMFSALPRSEYSPAKAAEQENLLDVLAHAGVHVLWRDNNSDSKGVALRAAYQDYKLAANNPICDAECRDEGMLVGLQEYIDGITKGDIVIVLHQMGNHGPAYYKRYPSAFEVFTPVCHSNEFDKCSEQEIINAYDNALVYTDYFLSKTIEFLRKNSGPFETALIYMSDHGESLGEYGVYLHGLPYAMAPESQKHIAALFWFGKTVKYDRELFFKKRKEHFSQDNLFHTVLGVLEIDTDVYDHNLDLVEYLPERDTPQ